MSLTDILYGALDSVPEARCAGVVSTDGLSIEMVYAEDDDAGYDLELAELELATLAANAGAAAERIGAGLVLDFSIETEDLAFLAALITPGYYAVLALPADGELAEPRLVLRDLVGQIRDEL